MSEAPRSHHPLWQLILYRLRGFYREPAAVFWTYGFPLIMVVALGLAFRNQAVEQITVDIDGANPTLAAEALSALESPRYKASVQSEADWRRRLRTGKTDVVVRRVDEGAEPRYEFHYDPTRPQSAMARFTVDDSLQRAAGRKDPAAIQEVHWQEPGGRYIDFLVPGLLGMNIMGGGLWGVGFSTVDMRIRKLLKRFLATPMRRTDFLMSIMIGRLLFLIPEVVTLLGFSWLMFGVVVQGSLFTLSAVVLLGAVAFAGIGLLVASRAKTIETVSGLMNLIMLPMWILSGIFFSSERFPDFMQPVIKALPLTLLIDSLREIAQDGAGLATLWPRIIGLALWGGITFVLALKWFRWS